jgi:hypothetical protein
MSQTQVRKNPIIRTYRQGSKVKVICDLRGRYGRNQKTYYLAPEEMGDLVKAVNRVAQAMISRFTVSGFKYKLKVKSFHTIGDSKEAESSVVTYEVTNWWKRR